MFVCLFLLLLLVICLFWFCLFVALEKGLTPNISACFVLSIKIYVLFVCLDLHLSQAELTDFQVGKSVTASFQSGEGGANGKLQTRPCHQRHQADPCGGERENAPAGTRGSRGFLLHRLLRRRSYERPPFQEQTVTVPRPFCTVQRQHWHLSCVETGV